MWRNTLSRWPVYLFASYIIAALMMTARIARWHFMAVAPAEARAPLKGARIDSTQKFLRSSARACATSRSQCATAE
jgi:hypothetical protein